MPLTQSVGAILTPYMLPKWLEIRVTLITVCFILGCSILLIGPAFEEMNLTVMLVGLFLSGFCFGILVIPLMAEMMLATKIKFIGSDLEHANSLLSGILNSMYAIGQALAPLLGSVLY